MATFVQLQDEVLKTVGRPNLAAGHQFRGRVKDKINNARLILANGLDLPELQKNDTSLTTVASTQNYALPADCQFIHSITDTTNDVRLIKRGQSGLDEMDSTTTDLPKWYGRFINEIHLSPIPDGAYALRVRYHFRPALLVADADPTLMGDEWDEPIISLASALLAIATNRMDTAREWLGQFQALIGIMRITGHMLTQGADEGLEITNALQELAKVGAPGTIPRLDISAPGGGSV